MNKFIFKYPIKVSASKAAAIVLPINYEILSLKAIEGQICLYALVDPTETEKEVKKVITAWTGDSFTIEELEDIKNNYTFLGTAIDDMSLVWHVWIEK